MLYLTAASVALWFVAWSTWRNQRPGTSSYASEHAREGTSIFGLTIVVVPVVGLPAAAVAERTDGLLPPLLFGGFAFPIALALVHMLGRRFPGLGLTPLR